MNNELEKINENEPLSVSALIFNNDNMRQIDIVADMMSQGRSTVPDHLRKSKGDCFAVTLQAMQWGMNPFAVAQKTHLVNGTLGYEGQLVNAVITSSREIQGRFYYEYQGDWKNHNIKGSDAAIRTGAVIHGEDQITWGEWLFVGDVAIKNSPLWKTVPKQQAAYLSVKYWSRIYCPQVMLGIYTPDELEDINIKEKIINPVETKVEGTKTESIKKRLKNKIDDPVEHAPDEVNQEHNVTFEQVVNAMEEAKDLLGLEKASLLAKDLSNTDKDSARTKYKQCYESIKNNIKND